MTIVHKATQQQRMVHANERGDFLAPMLPAGAYDLAAEYPGFKRKSISGILLRVDQTVTMPVTIKPGNVSETIEVVGGAPLLESETS